MNKARVIEEHKTNYSISDNGHEYTATVRGTFFEDEAFPKVGDIVTYNKVSGKWGQGKWGQPPLNLQGEMGSATIKPSKLSLSSPNLIRVKRNI